MTVDPAVIAEARELYAGEPAAGEHVERALREKANAEAYGQDTSAPDKILNAAGYSKRLAARKRAAQAAAEKETAKAEPPKGRTTPAQARQAKT